MSSLFLCLLSRILLYGFTTICLSIDVHFSCLQFLATINAANRNIHVQVFVWICILISLEQVFRVICICVCVCVCVCTHTHIYFFFLIREACHLLSFSDSILHTPILPKGEIPNLSKTVFQFLLNF